MLVNGDVYILAHARSGLVTTLMAGVAEVNQLRRARLSNTHTHTLSVCSTSSPILSSHGYGSM